ncbi:MAG: ATP-binding cassette domain-containing protein [Coriobacteriaceae bacterium]|nr:ATP-binding cassette domain-containing protein [Coriobacteriaceae bacterium]
MLEARDLTFAYPGAAPVLQGVSLCVAPGERVALTAPSGRGKTTLCQLLAGYLQPARGQVLADGAPLPTRGACPVQMIWQHPERVLDPRLTLGRSLEQAGAPQQRVMEALGIRPQWMSRYPHELSGGELQRFCIARALGASPRYLIADEVSTMLDAVTQAQLWGFLLEEQQRCGFGMLLVTHAPQLQELLATRVVEL